MSPPGSPIANGRTFLDDEWGDPGSPWTIQRALRDARDRIDLPGDFRFHDLRHASAKTAFDTYGHLWPDRDETSRAAVAAIYKDRKR